MDPDSFVAIESETQATFPAAHMFKTLKLQIEEDTRNAQLNPLWAIR